MSTFPLRFIAKSPINRAFSESELLSIFQDFTKRDAENVFDTLIKSYSLPSPTALQEETKGAEKMKWKSSPISGRPRDGHPGRTSQPGTPGIYWWVPRLCSRELGDRIPRSACAAGGCLIGHRCQEIVRRRLGGTQLDIELTMHSTRVVANVIF